MIVGAILTAIVVAIPAWAAPGDLDTAFGGTGIVKMDAGRGRDAAFALAVQPDGKIVSVGGSGLWGSGARFAVARHLSTGAIDTTFGGGDGVVTTNITSGLDAAFGVAIGPGDGKILVAGDAGFDRRDSRFALVRYNPDGTLDTSFGGGDGITITNFTRRVDTVTGLAFQPDGKLLVSGAAGVGGRDPKFALARYTSSGSLDTTFSGDGKVTTNLTSAVDWGNDVEVDPAGKIVLAGVAGSTRSAARFGVVRYNSDGTLDSTFSGDGRVTTNFTRRRDLGVDVEVYPDQRVVVAGGAGWGGDARFALARYNADGTLDTTFSTDGKTTANFNSRADGAYGLAIDAAGNLIAVGQSGLGGSNPKAALARFTSAGSLDPAFSGDGKLTTDFSPKEDWVDDVALDSANRIVVAGGSGWGGSSPKFALARYVTS